MNIRQWLYVALLIGIALLTSITLADDDYMEARRLEKAGSILSLETILESVKKQQTGRILEVELEHEHGRYIYEIELLDSAGVVWEIAVDAATGMRLKTELEH